MKKLKGKMKKINWKKVIMVVGIAMIFALYMSISVFATGNVGGEAPKGKELDDFNKIVKFLAGWIGKLGMVVAFVGAIQFGFAFKNDDADGKTKGLRTLMSGIVVAALTQSLQLFGIA